MSTLLLHQVDPKAYTLLVVDDNPTNLKVMVDFLSHAGFRVLMARSGESGIQRARHGRPDLILIDVLMPGIDGFETCRRLKADSGTRDIPVIFMTALADITHKVQGFEAGAVDYITKPIQQQEVLARLTTHLRIRDLTHNLEKKVSQRTAELSQMNQELELLLYLTAHDLRGPLRTIQVYTDFIQQKYSAHFDEKGQDFQQRVIVAADRMYRMLDHIALWAETRRVEPPKTPIAGQTIVKRVLTQLETEIEATQARVHTSGSYPDLYVTEEWGSRALHHLVANALSYVQDGTPPDVEIIPYEGDEGAGFAVLDKGPGISPEQIERLFTLFQRGVTQHHEERVGAGLTLVRRIAEQHQGHAWGEPRPGGGSCFVVTFGSGRLI